ncbi:MAG TPA: hypothetical protein VGJ18_25125 [Gemmatimonadaceae bacterium]|jgi:uncharacterized membrane protein
MPARIADVYETLSWLVRFLNRARVVASLGTDAGVTAVAPAAAVSRAVLSRRARARRVVSRAVSLAARDRIVSMPAACCGVDAVETGGAPLLTDSGPQAVKMKDVARAAAHAAAFRIRI